MTKEHKIICKKVISELVKINKRYKNLYKKKNIFEQGIDSLDFFKLVFKLEKIFKKKIPSNKYNSLNTIDKIGLFFQK